MRLALVLIALALSCGAAQAAEPQLKLGTPYPQVREQMIAQGFIPQVVTVKGYEEVCAYDALLCELFPELESCTSNGVHQCRFIFRSKADRTYWTVVVRGGFEAQREFPQFRLYDLVTNRRSMKNLKLAGDVKDMALRTIPEPQFKRGQSYAQVRAAFQAQGFQPVAPPRPKPDRCPRQAMCARYPEIVRCSEDLCTMLFRDSVVRRRLWQLTSFNHSGGPATGDNLKATSLHYTAGTNDLSLD